MGIVEPPTAVPGDPLSKRGLSTSALAARSPTNNRTERGVLLPVAFGKASVCRTVWFSDRLGQEPCGKPTGVGVDWEDYGMCRYMSPLTDKLQKSPQS